MKRLSDALTDRDPIRSVILNTGINQDGFTVQGITHPNRDAQAELILETYNRIGLRPGEVSYIEAHGTGTIAGDHEELSAIANVFITKDRSTPMYVGSNKGSIGHTESTSGLASILKTVAMLDHQIIPPVAGFMQPKPGLPLGQLTIPTKQLPWPHTDNGIPRASINSFGYGGANAHAILERGPRMFEKASEEVIKTGKHLFVLSANSSKSLQSMLEKHADYIKRSCEVPLSDVSYTLCQRRSAMSYRFSCVASDQSELQHEFRRGAQALFKPVPSQRNIVFVFTGQGAQWAGMGRELLLKTTPSEVFRKSICASRDALLEFGADWDLAVELTQQDSKADINRAEFAQPATTAIQIALIELLHAQGVEPSMVVGHSSGEIAAAYAAGRLSQRAALFIAYHRGFMAAASKTRGLPRGAMLSVGLGETGVTPYLQDLEHGEAIIACVNSPSSVTISGDLDAIEEVMARIAARKEGIFQRKLLVDTAYHSHHMRAVEDDYCKRLADLDNINESCHTALRSEDKIIMVSSVTGKIWSTPFNASYWVKNLVSPVRFSDAIEKIAYEHHGRRAGHALFLEVGPHSALAGPTRQCLAASHIPKLDYDFLPTLQRGTTADASALELAGRLFERGIKLQFEHVSNLSPFGGHSVVRPDLPTYAWDHSTKHWHESRLNREYRMRQEPYHDLLGVRIEASTSIEPHWRHMIGVSTLPWLADHVIDGLMIFPGAGYVCMAAQAIVQYALEKGSSTVLESLVFTNIEFLRALVVPDPPQRVEVQLSFQPVPGASPLHFHFCVAAFSEGKWHEHCKGTIEAVLDDSGNCQHMEGICPSSGNEGTDLEIDELYLEMARDGNTYGPTFRGLHALRLAPDATGSVAVVKVPDIAAVMPAQHQSKHILHPTTFDSMFHVGIPIIRNCHGSGSVMPVKIGQLIVSVKAQGLSRPGSKLDVAATLTSSHFRATHIDMTVTSNRQTVLVASDIESRSLATSADSGDGGICYDLEWRHDVDFLRAKDLPVHAKLSDLMAQVCFKNPKLKILEMTKYYTRTTLEVLTSITAHGGTLVSYDYLTTSPTVSDESRRHLNGYPVRYTDLEEHMNLRSQDSATDRYDVVILSDIDLFTHGSNLVGLDSLVLLVLDAGTKSDWETAFDQAFPSFRVQLTFTDDDENSTIALARNMDTHDPATLSKLQFLTHSQSGETPFWVESIIGTMHDSGFAVSHEKLESSMSHPSTVSDSLIVIVDDLPKPILSDRETFEAAVALLQQKVEIIWLSPETSPSMYQVTGVARTAHAENNDLRLTTVHIDPEALQHCRIANLLPHWLHHVANRDGTSHNEREYRITGTAAVLVPRLHRNDQLNEAISSQRQIICRETEAVSFSAPSHATVLCEHEGRSGATSFSVDDKNTDLAENDIQIHTQAFVLSRSEDASAPFLGEYAGVVKCVGRNVKKFSAGDSVVAISTNGVVGHSSPIVPCGHVVPQPKVLDLFSIMHLFLPALAATYAVRIIANIPPEGGSLVVHGALTDFGRATVAVARSLGARITVTAIDDREATKMSQLLDMRPESIIVGRSSLLSSRSGTNSFDSVVLASKDPVPPVVWTCLKPFGNATTYSPSFQIDIHRLPRNATIRICHISGILRAQPDLVPDLMEYAIDIVTHIQSEGLDLPVYSAAQVAEARRMLLFGLSNRVVIEATPQTLVRAALPVPLEDHWADPDATYVVAGGMGDLGKRLLLIMARRGAKHLVTLSRRAVDVKMRHAMTEQLGLVSPGCQLHCVICDITREESLKDAAQSLMDLDLPPVRGVIQSAVFLEVSLVIDHHNTGEC